MEISDKTQKFLTSEYGYDYSIDDYFQDLVDEHSISYETVEHLAELLGEEELFDGLIVACEDASIRTEGF